MRRAATLRFVLATLALLVAWGVATWAWWAEESDGPLAWGGRVGDGWLRITESRGRVQWVQIDWPFVEPFRRRVPSLMQIATGYAAAHAFDLPTMNSRPRRGTGRIRVGRPGRAPPPPPSPGCYSARGEWHGLTVDRGVLHVEYELRDEPMLDADQVAYVTGTTCTPPVRYLIVDVPAWATGSLIGLPTLWYAVSVASQAWRWERRRRAGRCMACGYDLRATPGRCPECGRVPS